MTTQAKVIQNNKPTTTQQEPRTTNKTNNNPLQPNTNMFTPFSQPNQIRIAWLAPGRRCGQYKADSSVNVLKFAISIVKGLMLHNVDIRVKWYDSKCTAQGGRVAALTARVDLDPDLILGPPSSAAMKEVASLASRWNIPVFGWGSDDPALEDRSKFPTLVRVFPPLNTLAPTIYFLNSLFNWSRFSIVSDSQKEYTKVSDALAGFIQENNATLASSHVINPNMSDAEIKNTLTVVKTNARIVLLSVPWTDLRRYILLAQELNMTSGDFSFLCFNNELRSEEDLQVQSQYQFAWSRNDSLDNLAKSAFESVIQVTTDVTNVQTSFDLLREFLNKSGEFEAYENLDLPAPGNPDFEISAAYLYDATMLWAHFANVIISEGGNIRDGRRILQLVRGVELFGLTGSILMNNHGDRLGDVWMLDMDTDGVFNDFLNIKNNADGGAALTRPIFDCVGLEPGVFDSSCSYDVIWPGGQVGAEHAPSDTPVL